MIRAVVDLNVLVSAYIIARGIPYQILTAWQQALYSLISSEGMIVELEGKLYEPKLAQSYSLTPQGITTFLALLRTQAELVVVPEGEIRPVTGDPEDDLVLATGRLAQADYLVTGDRGLLGLGQYEGMQIVSARDFFQLLAQQQG